MITPERIKAGLVYIEVCPMVDEVINNVSWGRLAIADETPEYYDVVVRPDHYETTAGEDYEEFEYLTQEEAEAKVAELELKYPGIHTTWILP